MKNWLIFGLLFCASLMRAQTGPSWSGGVVSGGQVQFNPFGQPNYVGSPHGIGTAVNITTVPNVGTSVLPACGQSMFSELIDCGNLTGSGTVFTDTQFSSALGGQPVQYIRLTDASFVSGTGTCAAFTGASSGQNSFEIGPGGGDYTNVANLNHTLWFVAQVGGGVLVTPVRSDYGASACPLWPTGDGDNGVYGTSIAITGFAGTSGTLTFTNTGNNQLTANEIIGLGDFMGGNTGLNNQLVTVPATGLTSTTFEATVTGSGYSSGAGAAGQQKGVMDVSAWWSGVDPNIFYVQPSTAIYKMTISGCNLTHLTIAQGCTVTSTLIHDFNGDACFTTELAPCASNTKCWNGVFNVDKTDTHFLGTMAVLGDTFSVNANPFAQDTGTKVLFYDTVNGCKEYETRKGLISPSYNSPPSATIVDQNSTPLLDRAGIHDDTMTRAGTSGAVGITQCALSTAVLPTPRALTWAATHVYAANFWIIPADGNNTKGAAMYTSAGGTSGGTEPTWDGNSIGGSITDGTITWTYFGNFGALTDWPASTPIAAYSFWKPTTNNAGLYVYQNINASGGVTGASRPTFNQTGNTTTADNGGSGPIWLNVGNNTQGFGANQCSSGPDRFYPSTGLIYTNPSNTYTGHYCDEDHTVVSGGGNLTFGLTQFAAWTNTEPLIPNNPAGSGSPDPGQHIGCANQNNGLDNLPIIGGMAYGTNAINTKLSADTTGCKNGSIFPVSCAAIPNSPGYEVVGFQQASTFCANPNGTCDHDTYIRFGLQFNSGQSAFFNGQQGTGGPAQDGSGFGFTSDMDGTLGNTAGGTNAAPNGIDWKLSTAFATGTLINPSQIPNCTTTCYNPGNFTYVATTVTGASSGTEPNPFNQTVGGTTTDGGITWTNIGSPTGSTTTSAGPRIDAFIMVLK